MQNADSPAGLLDELESAELCVRALMDAVECATVFDRPRILHALREATDALREATDAYVALTLDVLSRPIPETAHV